MATCFERRLEQEEKAVIHEWLADLRGTPGKWN